MALTAEQKRRKREKKLEKAAREVAAPVSRPRTEGPLLGEFLGCCLRGSGRDGGLVNLMVVRALTTGGARVAAFLIDPDCLGVKDAFWSDRSASAARRSLAGIREDEDCLDIAPSQARRILEQAVDFARGLGFEPGGDYTGSTSILAGVESAAEEAMVRFPSQEKPIYFAGPRDSSFRIREVLKTLMESVGPEGFDYVIDASQVQAVQDVLGRLKGDRSLVDDNAR
jgi:hypothetical protein